MAGGVLDLNDPAIFLPDFFLVDTNILYERLSATLIPRLSISTISPQQRQRLSLNAARATAFFRRLRVENAVGLVGPTASNELTHLVIGDLLEQYGNTFSPKLPWRHVYKAHPSALPPLKPILMQIHSSLSRAGLVFLSHDHLPPTDGRASYIEHLTDLCCTYALDCTRHARCGRSDRGGTSRHRSHCDHGRRLPTGRSGL